MDYRITTIIGGLVLAIFGFAFAFSGQRSPSSLSYAQQSILWVVYPNLVTGIVIGIGGIVISLIGSLYFGKRNVT